MPVSSIITAAWPRYSHVAVLLAFFSVVETEKKSHGERSGEYKGFGCLALFHTEFDVNSLFKSDVHSSNSKNHYWQGTQGFPPRRAT
jgi:hypothetical protein